MTHATRARKAKLELELGSNRSSSISYLPLPNVPLLFFTVNSCLRPFDVNVALQAEFPVCIADHRQSPVSGRDRALQSPWSHIPALQCLRTKASIHSMVRTRFRCAAPLPCILPALTDSDPRKRSRAPQKSTYDPAFIKSSALAAPLHQSPIARASRCYVHPHPSQRSGPFSFSCFLWNLFSVTVVIVIQTPSGILSVFG